MTPKTQSIVVSIGVFVWPVPPLFQLAVPPSGVSLRSCSIELFNGNVMHTELQDFEAEMAAFRFVLTGRDGSHIVNLKHVRTIRLSSPLHLVCASDPASLNNSAFAVRFRDGTTFNGITCGFVRDDFGLFLYLPEGEVNRAVFIPAQHLEDVQIRLLPSEAAASKQPEGSKTLAAKLNKRAKALQKNLRVHSSSDRGISSAEELKRALLNKEHQPTVKLGELMVEAELITPEQLNEALRLKAANRQRRLGDILIDMGVVTARLVQMAMHEKLGIPFVNLNEFKIDPLALELISANLANRYQVLPLMRMGESLVVAVESPLSIDFGQELGFLTGQVIVPVIANADELRMQIAKEYANLELAGAIAKADKGAALSVSALRDRDLSQVRVEELASDLDRDAPQSYESKDGNIDARVTDNALVRLVNKIIIEAHAQGASDIHVESNEGKVKTRIRFRRDGEMEDYLELQPTYRSAVVSRIKIMAGLDISEHRRAQDGKIVFGAGPHPIELRVAIIPTSNGLEDVVLRILGGVGALPMERLGLCGRDQTVLEAMVSRSYGLILVCGPTGSGKTTTLHSILHSINRPDIKIWTAEDPVEITQAGLRQVQVNPRIGWTFATAMRAFLRADPDVIMVGEMRDAETTKIGIEASLTGHLVFSTLHTNSAAESVVRLLELGMDSFNFADALIGILSQRLARTLCPACKKARIATEAEILALADEYCLDSKFDRREVVAQWHKTYAMQDRLMLYEPGGCNDCNNGYKGRTGIYELLVATPQVKTLIRAKSTVPQLVEAAQQGGMHMLRQDAIEKALMGILDLTSARAAST